MEALFQRGLAASRRQNARLFELRTATSLAQVWQDVGRLDDARTLLAPTYDWFTSGHDTVDLTQARAPQRLLLERCEQLADARMELLLYRLLHNLVGHWRDFVLEVLELVDVLFWKEVGPR